MYCTIKTSYGQYENCSFRIGKYRDGGLALSVDQHMDGYAEPLLTVTVNLAEPIPEGCIAVKDYSENEGVLDCLQELGIVTEVVSWVPSGYVMIPICRYDPEVLNLYLGGAN